jgi:DUF1680 family protein
MLELDVNASYAEVMERALYNGVISGVAQDGQHFFYQNPLASYPWPDAEKGSTQRPKWYGCACCPPNLVRMLTSLGEYIYTQTDTEIFTNLFIAGTADITLKNTQVKLTQRTAYPWKDTVAISVSPAAPAKFSLSVRIPAWCRKPVLKVNGKKVDLKGCMKKGYARITREWKKGDKVELTLPMLVERVYSNPKIRANVGRVALQHGPIVYCLEEVDNGKDLNAVLLPKDAKMTVKTEKINGQSVPVITAKAKKIDTSNATELYTDAPAKPKAASIKAIPYFMWANRAEGEMLVWIREL